MVRASPEWPSDLNQAHRHAGFDQERRGGMAQVMEADAANAGCRQRYLKLMGHVACIQRCADGRGEHEVPVLPAITSQQALVDLEALLRPQRVHRGGRQPERPAGHLGFWREQGRRSVPLAEHRANPDAPFVEVNVLPAQRKQFSLPHPRHDGEREQVHESVIAVRGQERPHFDS